MVGQIHFNPRNNGPNIETRSGPAIPAQALFLHGLLCPLFTSQTILHVIVVVGFLLVHFWMLLRSSQHGIPASDTTHDRIDRNHLRRFGGMMHSVAGTEAASLLFSSGRSLSCVHGMHGGKEGGGREGGRIDYEVVKAAFVNVSCIWRLGDEVVTSVGYSGKSALPTGCEQESSGYHVPGVFSEPARH